MRFGNKHLQQVYDSQLKNHHQRPTKTLQEYAPNIIRLVKGAYPKVSQDVCGSLVLNNFLGGLLDNETQQAIKLVRPQTCQWSKRWNMQF